MFNPANPSFFFSFGQQFSLDQIRFYVKYSLDFIVVNRKSFFLCKTHALLVHAISSEWGQGQVTKTLHIRVNWPFQRLWSTKKKKKQVRYHHIIQTPKFIKTCLEFEDTDSIYIFCNLLRRKNQKVNVVQDQDLTKCLNIQMKENGCV